MGKLLALPVGRNVRRRAKDLDLRAAPGELGTAELVVLLVRHSRKWRHWAAVDRELRRRRPRQRDLFGLFVIGIVQECGPIADDDEDAGLEEQAIENALAIVTRDWPRRGRK